MAEAIEGLKLCKEIATLTPQHSREINNWYQGMKVKTGKTLASLQVHCYTFTITRYNCISFSIVAFSPLKSWLGIQPAKMWLELFKEQPADSDKPGK